jgi:hypothetical protein
MLEEVVRAGAFQARTADGRIPNPDAKVKGGDTVLLLSGWHGALRIAAGYNEQPITIAATEGSKPELASVEIGEGKNWTIRGLTISPSLAPAPLQKRPRELVMLGERGSEQSENLVIENCFVYSVPDTSNWSGRDWVEKPSSGIWLGRHGRRHVARNNYVMNTRFGIVLCAPECVAEGNVVANFSADGLRVTRDGQIAQYNVIKNNFVGSRDGDDNHDDGIQVFLFNVGTGTVRDVVLRGNIIVGREREGLPYPNGLQGIGCFDGPLVRFLVESNIVCVSHFHGISLYDAQECRIQGNTCFSKWAGRAQPWVMLGQKKNQAGKNRVQDNYAHSFQFKADPQVHAQGNEVVSPEVFASRLRQLLGTIHQKYGKTIPAANLPRLEIK